MKKLKVEHIWYIFRWFPLAGQASPVHLYQVSRALAIHIWNLPERIGQLEEPTMTYLKSSKTDFAISRTNHDIRNIFQKGLEPREIQTSVGSGTPEILFNFVKTPQKNISNLWTLCEKYIFNYVNTHVTNVALVQSFHFVGVPAVLLQIQPKRFKYKHIWFHSGQINCITSCVILWIKRGSIFYGAEVTWPQLDQIDMVIRFN